MMPKYNWNMVYIYLLSTGITFIISMGLVIYSFCYTIPHTLEQDRQIQYEDGQRAAQLNLPSTSNPYLDNHEDARTWLRGYMDYKECRGTAK